MNVGTINYRPGVYMGMTHSPSARVFNASSDIYRRGKPSALNPRAARSNKESPSLKVFCVGSPCKPEATVLELRVWGLGLQQAHPCYLEGQWDLVSR